MKRDGLAPVQHGLECLTRISDLTGHLNPAQQYLLVNCVGTYVQLDRDQEEELMTTLEEQGRRDILEIYDSGITWADRKREQALAQARAEGLEQGLTELRNMILRLMKVRFGEVPPIVRNKVQALDSPEDFADLGERILTATSIDELDLLD